MSARRLLPGSCSVRYVHAASATAHGWRSNPATGTPATATAGPAPEVDDLTHVRGVQGGYDFSHEKKMERSVEQAESRTLASAAKWRA